LKDPSIIFLFSQILLSSFSLKPMNDSNFSYKPNTFMISYNKIIVQNNIC
jgi:hypothetical protein